MSTADADEVLGWCVCLICGGRRKRNQPQHPDAERALEAFEEHCPNCGRPIPKGLLPPPEQP